MNPLISVIVPVYMVEQLLPKCIESILNQTYRNFELILVNDGSKDNCLSICEKYARQDQRIRVINKKNGGLSDARNAGLNNAKGDYITFVDSDDYVEDNYLEFMLTNLLENNADISCGKHNVIYPNAVIKAYSGKKYVLDSKSALEMLLYQNDMDVSAWAKLYRRELFSDIRFPVGRLYEDTATTFKLVDKANVIVLDSKPIYNYVIRSESITNQHFDTRKLDLIKSSEEMNSFVGKKYPDLDSGCSRNILYAHLGVLVRAIRADNPNVEIINNLLKYVRKNGGSVLADPKAKLRDKIAIICSHFGYKGFMFSWNIYEKLRGSR